MVRIPTRWKWIDWFGTTRTPKDHDTTNDSVAASTHCDRETGEKIYFVKHARLSPENVRTMYPNLDDFLAVKNRVNSEHRLESNLARRLQ